MTDSKDPDSSSPNTANYLKRVAKGTRWLIPLFLVVVVIAAIFGYEFLLQAHQSQKSNQPNDEFPSASFPTEPDYSYTPEYSPADFEAELKINRTKWNSKLITHYRISIDLSQLGSIYDQMPWMIEVQEDDVISMVDAQGQVVSPEDHTEFYLEYQKYFTVPALFSSVEQTYLSQPPMILVEYDPTYGYPKTIYVDPWVEPCCMNYTITVRDLQVLP